MEATRELLYIRVLGSVSESRYSAVNEIHIWVEDKVPSVAILLRMLEQLEVEGLIIYEAGRGYTRTPEGSRVRDEQINFREQAMKVLEP